MLVVVATLSVITTEGNSTHALQRAHHYDITARTTALGHGDPTEFALFSEDVLGYVAGGIRDLPCLAMAATAGFSAFVFVCVPTGLLGTCEWALVIISTSRLLRAPGTTRW